MVTSFLQHASYIRNYSLKSAHNSKHGSNAAMKILSHWGQTINIILILSKMRKTTGYYWHFFTSHSRRDCSLMPQDSHQCPFTSKVCCVLATTTALWLSLPSWWSVLRNWFFSTSKTAPLPAWALSMLSDPSDPQRMPYILPSTHILQLHIGLPHKQTPAHQWYVKVKCHID